MVTNRIDLQSLCSLYCPSFCGQFMAFEKLMFEFQHPKNVLFLDIFACNVNKVAIHNRYCC